MDVAQSVAGGVAEEVCTGDLVMGAVGERVEVAEGEEVEVSLGIGVVLEVVDTVAVGVPVGGALTLGVEEGEELSV